MLQAFGPIIDRTIRLSATRICMTFLLSMHGCLSCGTPAHAGDEKKYELVVPINSRDPEKESEHSIELNVDSQFLNPLFPTPTRTELLALTLFYPKMSSYKFENNYKMLGCAGYCGGRIDLYITNDYRRVSNTYWKQNPSLFGAAPSTVAEFYTRNYQKDISSLPTNQVVLSKHPEYGFDQDITVDTGSGYSEVLIKLAENSSAAALFAKCDAGKSIIYTSCTLHFSSSKCKTLGIEVSGVDARKKSNIVDIYKDVDRFISDQISSDCSIN